MKTHLDVLLRFFDQFMLVFCIEIPIFGAKVSQASPKELFQVSPQTSPQKKIPRPQGQNYSPKKLYKTLTLIRRTFKLHDFSQSLKLFKINACLQFVM